MSPIDVTVQHRNKSGPTISRPCTVDDIAVINTCYEDLQSDVNKVNEIVQWCGMKIKPSKCSLLSHQPPLRFGRALNIDTMPNIHNFKINNCTIPLVDEEGSPKYKYLGILRGKQIRQTPAIVYQKCHEKLKLIT